MNDILSSDILEVQFGPTAVAVLHQDAGLRIIATYVKASGRILEVSRVNFVPGGVKKFPDAHQAVLAGVSMGKAFREADIGFIRKTKAVYKQALPGGFRRWFGDDRPATVVAVSILAGPDKTPYAEILETYSPAVRWPESSGRPLPEHRAIIGELDEFLAARSPA